MKRRKKMIADAITQQAAEALVSGNRFQVREEHIGGEQEIKKLLTLLAVSCGANIRASKSHGLLTLYSDAHDDGTVVMVATIE